MAGKNRGPMMGGKGEMEETMVIHRLDRPAEED